jgi:hypothetical protein
MGKIDDIHHSPDNGKPHCQKNIDHSQNQAIKDLNNDQIE